MTAAMAATGPMAGDVEGRSWLRTPRGMPAAQRQTARDRLAEVAEDADPDTAEWAAESLAQPERAFADDREILRLAGAGERVVWSLRFGPHGRYLAARYAGNEGQSSKPSPRQRCSISWPNNTMCLFMKQVSALSILRPR